jgi:bifunctional polynucleotide phosphatase/kinase
MSTKKQKGASSASCIFRTYKTLSQVHPFFTKKDASGSDKTLSTFQWLASFGPKRTCLHGTNSASKIVYGDKIAAFDLDGTLIESTFGKGKKTAAEASGSAAFQWWNMCVPSKLEEVFKAGYVHDITFSTEFWGQ